MDEEIIGEDGDGPAYKPHLQGRRAQGVDDINKVPGLGRTGRRGGPPAPARLGQEEEGKNDAKQRLQRLIREFAHDAVGPGLEVEAEFIEHESCGINVSDEQQAAQIVYLRSVVLRMDRRLSRLELWPVAKACSAMAVARPLGDCNRSNFVAVLPPVGEGEPVAATIAQHSAALPTGSPSRPNTESATTAILLQQVPSIFKGVNLLPGEIQDNLRDGSALTVQQRSGPTLRLVFDSPAARDRAYTALRIFQMSVDQSLEVQSRPDSDHVGYASD